MTYRFDAMLFTEGMRTFIEIPFNVHEETGLKGNIPCRVSICERSFECKLIPARAPKKDHEEYEKTDLSVPRLMLFTNFVSDAAIFLHKTTYAILMQICTTATNTAYNFNWSKSITVRK